METELEVLKKIWENNSKAYIRLISTQTRLGIDYTRYICNYLFKKEQIKPVKGKRDWYRITSKGERELKSSGIIKPKVSRKTSDVEKVVYYLPRSEKEISLLRGLPKKLKVKPSESNFQKVKIKGLKDKLIKPEEKKLNLGRSIKKAVSFLKQFLF